MSAMFSESRSTTSSSGHLVEFKAGRSRLEPGSGESMRRVVAEETKGLVFIKQSSDMLIHFCWKNRESGAVVDDLIIFPDDAEFKVVNGCPDGKVYMLKFKSSGEMKLFWLQDSNPDIEKDLVKKVNDALNKPPTARPSNSRSGPSTSNNERSTAGGSVTIGQFHDRPWNLTSNDSRQLTELLEQLENTPSDPSRARARTATRVAVQSILSNLVRDDDQREVNVSLGEALSNEAVAEVVRDHAEELAPQLPPSEDPAGELSETVRTPQFRQAADTIGHALQTGQLGPVLSQFGMNDETVQSATQGDLRGFAQNLTKAEEGAEPTEEEKKEEEKKEEEEEEAKSEKSEDDATREPEPKRNRPDLDDMDID